MCAVFCSYSVCKIDPGSFSCGLATGGVRRAMFMNTGLEKSKGRKE